LGKRAAFLSIWFLWISNAIWYPLILSFIATTFLYAVAPELSHHPWWVVGVMLCVFWAVLLSNLLGIRYSGWFGTVTFLLGTLLPGGALIIFGAISLFQGDPSHMDFSLSALIPKQTSLNEIVFLVSMVLCFAGMEMNAIHAKDVHNPRKTFPRTIFISAGIIGFLTMIGIFSVGIILPKEEVNLTTAIMEAMSHYLHRFHIEGLLPVFSVAIAIGALGAVSCWIVGTSKGLLVAAQDGGLPSYLLRENQKGVPVTLLLIQGGIVSFLVFMFVVMPSLSYAFWILTALSSQLYLITYILMFLSGVILKYKKSEIERTYSIPGGKKGMIGVAGIGIISSIFAFFIGFVPPSQIDTKNTFLYCGFLVVGIGICYLVSYFLNRSRSRLSCEAQSDLSF